MAVSDSERMAHVIVGLFAKTRRIDFAGQFKEVLEWFRSKDCVTLVDQEVVDSYGLTQVTGVDREDIPRQADALVVFGGDGTMLSVARLVKHYRCPILGVNLGSLGFMTEITVDRLYLNLKSLIDGSYSVEERCMLQAEVLRDSRIVETHHALNDLVINKAALARVISVDAYFDESFIANFVADGMIVSTPTGSTAYSLSAGGPIVHPSLESILVTPICPHTLTNRPLIIPPTHKIRFVLRSGEDVMITIDGQVGVRFEERDEVVCTRSPYRVQLIKPTDRNFFHVLREKLKWAKR
jgi:NAD+ kinase